MGENRRSENLRHTRGGGWSIEREERGKVCSDVSTRSENKRGPARAYVTGIKASLPVSQGRAAEQLGPAHAPL